MMDRSWAPTRSRPSSARAAWARFGHALAAFVALCSLAALAETTNEPVPRAEDVLERAVAYHDPHGVWETGALRLRERLDLSGESRERLGFDRMESVILIDHENGVFRCTTRTSGAALIEYAVTGDEGETRLNGSAEYTPDEHPLLPRPSAEEARALLPDEKKVDEKKVPKA